MKNVDLAKKWFQDRGYDVREHEEGCLLMTLDGYEFELSQSEIDYRAEIQKDIEEDELLLND